MAWSIVGHSAAGLGANGGTFPSSGIAVSAGDLVILSTSCYQSANTITPSDNIGGNSYTALDTSYSAVQQSWYSVITNGGTMKWTLSASGVYNSGLVLVFSGNTTTPLDTQNSADSGSSSTSTGSITPTANDLVATFLAAINNTAAPTISGSSFGSGNIVDTVVYSSGNYEGGASAYLQPASNIAYDPLWSATSATTCVAVIAAFLEASGGTPTVPFGILGKLCRRIIAARRMPALKRTFVVPLGTTQTIPLRAAPKVIGPAAIVRRPRPALVLPNALSAGAVIIARKQTVQRPIVILPPLKRYDIRPQVPNVIVAAPKRVVQQVSRVVVTRRVTVLANVLAAGTVVIARATKILRPVNVSIFRRFSITVPPAAITVNVTAAVRRVIRQEIRPIVVRRVTVLPNALMAGTVVIARATRVVRPTVVNVLKRFSITTPPATINNIVVVAQRKVVAQITRPIITRRVHVLPKALAAGAVIISRQVRVVRPVTVSVAKRFSIYIAPPVVIVNRRVVQPIVRHVVTRKVTVLPNALAAGTVVVKSIRRVFFGRKQ